MLKWLPKKTLATSILNKGYQNNVLPCFLFVIQQEYLEGIVMINTFRSPGNLAVYNQRYIINHRHIDGERLFVFIYWYIVK